jgi:hypothetical protein
MVRPNRIDLYGALPFLWGDSQLLPDGPTTPALLTSISGGPKVESMALLVSKTDCQSETSQTKGSTFDKLESSLATLSTSARVLAVTPTLV